MIGLVERATELHQVMLLLERPGRARGGLLVLEGAAGIGKTTILQEAAAIARQEGIPVARATGHPIESTLSFGLVRQLLEPTLARVAPEVRAELATGPARAAVAMLDGAPAAGIDELELVHAAYRLVAELATTDGCRPRLARHRRRAVGRPVLGDLPALPRPAPGRPAGGAAGLTCGPVRPPPSRTCSPACWERWAAAH